MRTLLRAALHSLAFLSLAIALLTAGIWVKYRNHPCELSHQDYHSDYATSLIPIFEGFDLYLKRPDSYDGPSGGAWIFNTTRDSTRRRFEVFGIARDAAPQWHGFRHEVAVNGQYRFVFFPLWAVVAPLAVVFAFSVLLARRLTPHHLLPETGGVRNSTATLLAIISLVLCLTTARLWLHSRSLTSAFARRGPIVTSLEHFTYTSRTHSMAWINGEYRLIACATEDSPEEPARWPPPIPADGTCWSWKSGTNSEIDAGPPLPTESLAECIGFHLWNQDRTTASGQLDTRGLSIPAWLLPLLFSLPPLTRARTAIRKHYRTRHNLCPSCAYDLRESPLRCPECGATTKITPA